MTRITRYAGRLFVLSGIAFFSACQGLIEHCDYSVRLTYHYNQENTTTENQFGRFIKTTEVYIFDADGILYDIHPVTLKAGNWVSDLILPPGRYSVIAVGNQSMMSRTHDNNGEPKIGVTHREKMLLTLTERSMDGSDDGENFNSSERLYHGYRTFEVLSSQMSSIRVDMVHSHLDLMFTIRWKNDNTPIDTRDFYVLLKDLPSEYNLMPEFVYPTINTCANYDSSLHDEFAPVSLSVRHHIAGVKYDCPPVRYKQPVRLRSNVVSSQMISYRIRNCGYNRPETTISLWRGGTISSAPEQLMKDIHVNDFFNRNDIDLDRTLKQEYHIVLEVDPDTDAVSAWFADIADWDEGGGMGG